MDSGSMKNQNHKIQVNSIFYSIIFWTSLVDEVWEAICEDHGTTGHDGRWVSGVRTCQ